MKKRFLSLLFALLMIVSLVPITALAADTDTIIYTHINSWDLAITGAKDKRLDPNSNSFGFDKYVDTFDEYFSADTALEGVIALLEEGAVYINGEPVPTTLETSESLKINGNNAIWYGKNSDGSGTDGWRYKAHTIWRNDQNVSASRPEGGIGLNSCEDAALALIEGASRLQGFSWLFIDTDGDEKTDRLETTIQYGVQVKDISTADDNTIIVSGGDNPRTFTIPNANIGTTDNMTPIKVGDLALVWEAADGFHAERGYSTYGFLTANTHGSDRDATFTFNGVDKDQALITRDYMHGVNGDPTSVRNGQFWSVHKNDTSKLVIEWATAYGHPYGYTYPDEEQILKSFVDRMGDETQVTKTQYDKFFKEATAADGVKAIIAAGNFYINGYAIPKDEAEYNAKYPNGYKVNTIAWILKKDDKWVGGKNVETTAASRLTLRDTYTEAAFDAVGGISRGVDVLLYDTDGDGKTDLISTQHLEAMIADQISYNEADKTYSVSRGVLDSDTDNLGVAGRAFDGNHFVSLSDSNYKISADNFDKAISEGDMVLFWYGQNGWVMRKAVEKRAVYEGGKDHGYYIIDGSSYKDAMQFSRDNIVISNRNGEFANAHAYFGFTKGAANNTEGLESSLWLVRDSENKEYAETYGVPLGFTSNENAEAFLTKAIAFAKEKLGSVVISADGSGLAVGTKWVTKAVYDELDTAIKRAETVLESESSTPAHFDYQVYLLYLTLNGNSDDIGAKFAGYAYEGFDKKMKTVDGTLTLWADGVTGITDASYDYLFSGAAKEGVAALIATGKVTINGTAVPTSNDGSDLKINEGKALWKNSDGTWSWDVHVLFKGEKKPYTEAVVGFVNDVTKLRGISYDLTISGGVVTGLSATVFDVALANTVTTDGEKTTITVVGKGDNSTDKPNPSTIAFQNANVTGNPKSQNLVFYWKDTAGWHLKRANSAEKYLKVVVDAKGAITGTIDGAAITDTRLTLQYSEPWNRPSQPVRAIGWMMDYGTEVEVPVYQWTTDNPSGVVAGLSRRDAKDALQAAIKKSEAALATVAVSSDGKNVSPSKMWVTQAYHDIFTKAVSDAKSVYDDDSATASEYEGALYLLAQAYGGRNGDRFSWLDNTYFGKGDGFDTGYNGKGFWTAALSQYGTKSEYVDEVTTLITIKQPNGGSITAAPKYPSKGDTVVVTVTPKDGYEVKGVTVTDSNGKKLTITNNKNGTFSFIYGGVAVTIEAELVQASKTLPFTDVATNSWFYDDVVYANKNGLMTGTSASTFSPHSSLSRAMVATILWRLEGEPAAADGNFTDLTADWYRTAVNWAASMEIVLGYGNGTFGPEDSVTREQFAVIIHRYASWKGIDVSAKANLSSFADGASVSSWAIEAMKWSVNEKIINGRSGNLLNPQLYATRAEATAMLRRFLENTLAK